MNEEGRMQYRPAWEQAFGSARRRAICRRGSSQDEEDRVDHEIGAGRQTQTSPVEKQGHI